ncbi:MAG: beta-galactosidase [Phycisphaerae bacterium]|nr:beta-galactosidase [Phycisphaerae bacterium]
MPQVTYDGRSFMVDGRRIWVVSGSIHYARVPRDAWESRIHAAKLAGLNTIETPVFWNRHEPRPGHFDFSGDNDLRHFIQLIGQAGLQCILRIGPYIGVDWDFGGLPAWLGGIEGIKLRTANGPFLEACSRYITAVADRVRDLQITSPGKGGPIILVQNESAWTCGDDKLADAYLGELNRYLREAGFNVPTINANNLWQSPESEIECWTGGGDLLSTVRQLAAVRAERPRLVVEFNVGGSLSWGADDDAAAAVAADAAAIEPRLAQILAGGAQFNIHPFHGGTNFGFWGGKVSEHSQSGSGFATASRNPGAPLTESGSPGPTYAAVRRICTFASRFSRVLSSLDPAFRPVVIAPDFDGTHGTRAGSPSVVYASGAQGGVAFVFAGPGGEPGSTQSTRLLLADGTLLPVDVDTGSVAWCLFNTFIAGRSKIDYTNLSALGMVGSVVVLFGAPGATGVVSVNGSPLHVDVPGAKSTDSPSVIAHEGLTLVICSRQQTDHVFFTDDAVILGAVGMSPSGGPVLAQGKRHYTRLGADGSMREVSGAHANAKHHADRLTLSEWTGAGMADYDNGTSARFAAIDGPSDLASLGAPYGYGWYRLRLKAAGGKVRLAFPGSSDRLHVFVDGEPAGLVGFGPGADLSIPISLGKGPRTLVVLAENLGRASAGVQLSGTKGVTGHLWDAKPLKLPKPSVEHVEPIQPLTFISPIWEVQPGDVTLPERLTWSVALRKKSPLIFSAGPLRCRALLLVNKKPVAFLDRGHAQAVTIEPDTLKSGANSIQIAPLNDPGLADDPFEGIAANAQLIECATNLSAKAEWAFARWEAPRASAFQKVKAARLAGPTWWRATFTPRDLGAPVYFDASGLTKGQLYVNGRHVSRYFAATASGDPVPPQRSYFIPPSWLRADEENELVLFDEHGASPAKCRLVHQPDPR